MLEQLGAHHEGRHGDKIPRQFAGEGADHGLRFPPVGVVAGLIEKPGQDARGDPVAGGRGVVGAAAGAADQLFALRRGEEETAVVRVLVVIEECCNPRLRTGEVLIAAGRLVKGEGGPRHVGVIVQERLLDAPAATGAVMEQSVRR